MSFISSLGSRFKVEFIARIISIVASGLMLVILARLLEPSQYGLLFLALSIFSIFEMVSKLGIGKSTARYISNYKERSPGQIPHILLISFKVNTISILISVSLLIVFSEVIISLTAEPELQPLLILGVLFIPFITIFELTRLIFQGYEDIKLSSYIFGGHRITLLFLTTLFVALEYGAVGALLGYIISYALFTAIGIKLVVDNLYTPLNKSETVEDKLPKRIIKYSIPLIITNSAHILDKRVDTILVAFFLNPVAVSFYEISRQIIQFIQAPVSSLGFTLAPTYSAEVEKGNTERVSKLYETALIHTLVLYIPASAGIILVAEPAIRIIFGTDYSGAAPVLQILAIYGILRSVTNITSDGLDYLGKANARAVIKVICAVANFTLNILLIPIFGVVGAAFATVTTYAIYTIFNVYIITRILDIRYRKLVIDISRTIFVTGIMAIVVLQLVSNISGVLSLVAVIVTGGLIWGMISILVGLIDYRLVLDTLKG